MTLYRPLLLCCVILSLGQSASLAFSVGDKLQANGTVNVRQTAAGTLLGTQSSGTQGTVIGGPTVATLNGTQYTWYNMDWPSAPDGWVADIGLISAPPTVQTLSAASIAITSAQLRGSITPNGSSTTAYFQYGTSTSYGNTTSSGNFGTTSQTITFNISGLSANTTYHYRIVAQNGTGTTLGNDVTFTTSTQPVPTVQTLAATLVSLNSATLNGTVNPNGAITSFYFDYGTTTGYGSRTSVGNTSISESIGAAISGLSQNTLYHFRFVASNSGGTTLGSDATFTTRGQPVPTVQTLPASLVTTTSATLNGSINPNGANTTAYFQYGTTASYGSVTVLGNFGTNSQTIGTSVTGLAAGITYHFRIVASNSGGTNMGSDATFTTTFLPTGPVVQTLPATLQTPSSAQLNAYLNPNGGSATAHFEYGTSTSYGNSTTSGNFGLTPQNIGFNVTGLAPNTSYHYRIVASNPNGTSSGLDSSFVTASSPASVPPTITAQPQGQTLQAGGTATFSVSLNGSTPISYQWQRNGTALSGKTAATLTLNAVTTFDSDGYSVLVSNPYGSQLSATAWLSVYASPPPNPPPANPVVNPTTKPPIQPVLIPVSDTQLTVYNGTSFVTNGSIDRTKMTIVFTHGWNSTPSDWPSAMASNMIAGGVVNANILAWDWSNVADTGYLFLSRAFSATPSQGQKLGQALAATLGSSYGKPIHFAGHSLGTLVNATAANYLHEQTGGAFDPAKTHITLFDDAEVASIENTIVVLRGDQIPGLDGLQSQTGVPSLGWVSSIPRRSGWIDNYISLVGGRHQEAVNVFLDQSLDIRGF
jgi:pimeloyl-ACP methyl ester carboxylesterase